MNHLSEHAVVIAGGGPTGMMLAGELALAGVDVAIVERRDGPQLEGSRARGLHARTIEVLDQRGIADRFLARGQPAQVATFAGARLDIGDFPSRHPYGLALLQNAFEEILAGWVAELGVPVHRGREVTGLAQDDAGVDVAVSGGASLRAAYLVGCDGGRSVVRKSAGIEFPGWEPSVSSLIAEAEVRDEPPIGIVRDARGQHGLGHLEDGRVGVVVSGPYTGQFGPPTLGELRDAVTSVWGTDFGIHSPSWISRFTDATRQAASYRRGRVLLAGDAAHVHYPIGGQGLNLGVQDAVNLGWKLAQVVTGTSAATLLDTYHAERHPVAARVLRITMAQTAVTRRDDRTEALREAVAELLAMDEPRRRFGALQSGLDIRYDLGEGHPLLGRRMPDLDLATPAGPRRAYSFLHEGRPAFIDFGGPGGPDLGPWGDRVRVVEARYDGIWELPLVGEVSPPAAVLVRPDGHVAWVGDGTDAGLRDALSAWFGPVTRPRARPDGRATRARTRR